MPCWRSLDCSLLLLWSQAWISFPEDSFPSTEHLGPWPYSLVSDSESICLRNVAILGIFLNVDWPHGSLALAISNSYLISP